MPDTPQSLHTQLSSLSHTLTATLHPADPLLPVLSRTITVHTKRYTSHLHTIAISPETHHTDDPTRIEIEIPRGVFKAGEPIPLYVTVPPPRGELVVEQGVRLRNIKVEFVQTVKVKRSVVGSEDEALSGDSNPNFGNGEMPDSSYGLSSTTYPSQPSSSSKAPISPLSPGSASYRMIIARSGASCRFHSTKAVRLRFVLNQSDFQAEAPAGGLDSDAECPSITQKTLLHAVSFELNVQVSFVDTSNHTERFSTVTIPLVIIPPPAPLPEVEEWVDAAYQKKHDRPPAKTIRHDDADSSVPQYDPGVAGPSALSIAAPPPFEERDAPPPFFTEREASTSNRLPTFLESENEIIVPESDEQSMIFSHNTSIVFGEGVQFGFPVSEQFDGHSDVMPKPESAPPRNPELTEPEIVTLGRALALDQQEDVTEDGQLPPPPPAMDDPSDPPPSIDSEFRSPVVSLQAPSVASGYVQSAEPPSLHVRSPPSQPTHGQAPPPYLIPDNERDQGQVTRPPPYVDFIPSAPEQN
jgi:hypothetical protein